ncbi:hypothetical protein [Candidatus Ichthyocystis sparus]|uniref:hypothetical protein n=1 Tax=Candidatus Ichthyocystis sparus TaxID=1561004 RepID=UPI000B813424|nr:hypothetical protein [Candidatus Ichthyocystis sparus]
MVMSDIDFLNTAKEDGCNNLSLDDASLPSSLGPVLQVVVPTDSMKRIGGLYNRALVKTVIVSSILVSLIGSAGSEIISDPKWEVLKSRVCSMLFLQSKSDEMSRYLYRISNGSYSGEYYKIAIVPSLGHIIGELSFFRRSSADDHQANVVIMQLNNKIKSILSELASILFKASKVLPVDMEKYDPRLLDSEKYRFYVGNIRHCPDLYDYVDDNIDILTTDTTTSTTDYVDYMRSLLVILGAIVFSFIFLFLLLRCKCSRLKIFGVAKRAVRVMGRRILD